MNALSLLPPGFRGVERGCGNSEFAFVIAEVTEEGGGERMKPPDCAGGVDMAVLMRERTRHSGEPEVNLRQGSVSS